MHLYVHNRGTHTVILHAQIRTIFDIVPRWHQFGFQFVHLVRLPGRLSAWICCLWRPETKTALPLQGLLPPAPHQVILHHPPYVLGCAGGNGVHASEPSEPDSAAPHCNTELVSNRPDRMWSGKLLTYNKNSHSSLYWSLTFSLKILMLPLHLVFTPSSMLVHLFFLLSCP